MYIISFLRIIKSALQDMVRNFGMSFMTIIILVLMLLSVNTLLFIRLLTAEATSSIKEQIDVSIYFHPDAEDAHIQEVRDYLNAIPQIIEMIFHSKEEVLNQFREEHKDNPDIIASLEELEENPLGAALIIKTKTPADYQTVIETLNVPEYEDIIEEKTFVNTEKAIHKIDAITTQVERFTAALTIFFALIAFLIIFNTVRVAIYTQRTEISIKKLVGATNWFVRGPYMIESAAFSLISVSISFLMLYPAVRFIDPFVGVVFGTVDFLTNYFVSNILMLAGSQFLGVLFLTTITSIIAMRKHLKV